MIQVREMTDTTEGTCDWGGCDDETTAERLDPDSGEWLGVCARHGARPARPKTGRGTCRTCGVDYAWIGAYVAEEYVYVCPLPFLVIKVDRAWKWRRMDWRDEVVPTLSRLCDCPYHPCSHNPARKGATSA